jgi:putative phosphoribosyl transferase
MFEDRLPPPSGDVVVEAGTVRVAGGLDVPEHAIGTVVFAHGSGSSRHSPRNRQVAVALQSAGFATLLFDLLTEDEERDRANVFDIELLGGRLLEVVAWVGRRRLLSTLPVGLFGASTGAGAALWAAADPSCAVAAVVSRGGRPDLAAERLGAVRVPTLLIVGERDRVVLELNARARDRLRCPAELTTVPGATHLFEEPGALRHVSELAVDWFVTHLARPAQAPIS